MYEPVEIRHLIDSLQNELLWDKEHISEIMNIDPTLLSKEGSLENLPFKSLSNLSNFIGVSLENIFQNDIDFDVIKKRFFNSSVAIPDKYLVGAGTYIGTIRTFYHYINNKYNKLEAEEMLNHFQISKEALLNDDIVTNIILFNKILDYCIRHLGFTKEDLRLLAFRSYIDGKRKSIVQLRKENMPIKDLLIFMAANSNQYENNFSYTFKELSNKKFVLESNSRNEINDKLSINNISTEANNYFKQMCIEAVPMLVSAGSLSVNKVENIIKPQRQRVSYLIETC